ncbi:MAG: hypothetical protein FJ144_17295 [Deltaproteobacteria bacterium]|nr:hypothetical protein [Deltaproteobacteria bacterium]
MIYLHEIIRVVPGREEDYMASVLSLSFIPDRKRERVGHLGQLGLFRAAEHSGRWPAVVNVWEHTDWGTLTHALARQFQDTARDAKMEDWWRANTDLRSGGHDRVLLPTAYTRDRASLERDGVRGRLFVHEIVKLNLGAVPQYLERLGDVLPSARALGWELVGAYRVAWRPREALILWALDEWAALGRLSGASDAKVRAWNDHRASVTVDLEEIVLLPGRMNPLRRHE